MKYIIFLLLKGLYFSCTIGIDKIDGIVDNDPQVVLECKNGAINHPYCDRCSDGYYTNTENFCVEKDGVGANYYVNPNYNGESGLSTGTYLQPWTSIAQVNAYKFSTSDNLYFMAGTKLLMTDSLRVSWSGSAKAPVIIGAYYMSGGSPVHGLPPGAENVEPPPPGGVGDRPILDGQDHSVPTVYGWGGLVNVASSRVDYIIVRDLHIKNSGASGIRIGRIGSDDPTDFAVHHQVRNCYLERSGRSGIEAYRLRYSLIQGNRTYYTNYLNDFNHADPCPWSQGYQSSSNLQCQRVMGAGIEIGASFQEGKGDHLTVRNNVVEKANEGIGIYKGGRWALVEYNEVFDCGTHHIFVSGKSPFTTVKNNLVYGTNTARRIASTGSRGSGIVVSAEFLGGYQSEVGIDWWGLGGHKIFDNYVAGNSFGIWIVTEGTPPTYGHKNIEIYRNRVIDTNRNFHFSNFNQNWSGNQIYDNWSVQNGDRIHTNPCNPTGFTWSKNFYTCTGACSPEAFLTDVNGNCSNPQETKDDRVNQRILVDATVDFRNLIANEVLWPDKTAVPPWFIYYTD